MNRIRHDTENDLEIIRIENGNASSFVTIVPSFGANVGQIQLTKNGRGYPLLDGNRRRKDFFDRRMFNGAHLVPYPNRVKGGKYRLNGKEYRLPINYENENNAAHGFIHNRSFQLIAKKEEAGFAEIILHYSYNGDLSGYPFPFEITYTYALDEAAGFICSMTVTNSGQNTMPFGAGLHPYFSFGKEVDRLRLKMPPVWRVLTDSSMIPTGEEEPDERFTRFAPLGGEKLDTLFRFRNEAETHEVHLNDEASGFTVTLWMEGKAYPYCQIYIPPDRRSVAVEPMTCAVDAFNNGKGLVFIQPGESFKASFGVNLA